MNDRSRRRADGTIYSGPALEPEELSSVDATFDLIVPQIKQNTGTFQLFTENDGSPMWEIVCSDTTARRKRGTEE